MGIDFTCGEIDVRCGSYKLFENLKIDLIHAIIKFLKSNYDFEKDLILKLESCVSDDSLDYQKLNEVIDELNLYELDGFRIILDPRTPSIIDTINAENFMKSYDLVKEYVDEHFKLEDNIFYMYEVFEESINTGEDIYIG